MLQHSPITTYDNCCNQAIKSKKKKTYLWSQKEPLHSHNQCLAAVENVNFWVCENTGVLDVPLKPKYTYCTEIYMDVKFPAKTMRMLTPDRKCQTF